jgi:Polyketide cyclase / dehydrase and lipid transport
MAHGFDLTTVVDRPIDEVFAFLAQGTNDPKFSPRVLEIEQASDGPPGAGTVFRSTVKDAGMKTKREFELTEFQAPAKIRWTERSKNLVTVPDGGYDLSAEGDKTRVRMFNQFEGHGLGKLFLGMASRQAVKGQDELGAALKRAVEAG